MKLNELIQEISSKYPNALGENISLQVLDLKGKEITYLDSSEEESVYSLEELKTFENKVDRYEVDKYWHEEEKRFRAGYRVHIVI